MTAIGHPNVDKNSVVVRVNELSDRPVDGKFYKADLLKGFTLRTSATDDSYSVRPRVDPLTCDHRAISIPKSAFVGQVLRVAWVSHNGETHFRWYLLDLSATGDHVVWQVKAFIQIKRELVSSRSVLVPELR